MGVTKLGKELLEGSSITIVSTSSGSLVGVGVCLLSIFVFVSVWLM